MSVNARPGNPGVLVTGIGLLTPLGRDREASWRGLREGRHGFLTLDDVPHGRGDRPYAGAPGQGMSQNLDTVRVALDALVDAGRPETTMDPGRVGVAFGLSKGNLRHLAAAHRDVLAGRYETHDLGVWLASWPHAGASALARSLNFRGPCLAPVAACATGLVAALRGAELIRRGGCDLVLAGAADSSLDPFLLGAFHRMGVLARSGEGDDPGRAVRPWDRDRSGFLVGEGAAVLVLEREDHARARGVLPYAEFCGGTFGADAYHATNLNPDPANLAGLIGRALASAGVGPSEVDHVNVHGTATKANDPLECLAIRRAFGRHAEGLSCSANKAQIGHLLGAAGAVELAFTALAVRDSFVPPTLNLDDPDPLCDLDGTPHVGRARPIRAALKFSIGFGGHLAAAVLRLPDEPRRGPVVT